MGVTASLRAQTVGHAGVRLDDRAQYKLRESDLALGSAPAREPLPVRPSSAHEGLAGRRSSGPRHAGGGCTQHGRASAHRGTVDVDGRDAAANPGDHREGWLEGGVGLTVDGPSRYMHEVARASIDVAVVAFELES